MSTGSHPPMPEHRSAFHATQWSMVFAAQGDGSTALRALGSLCGAYWYPLYAFARRSGLGPHDAEDSVQGFFSDLLGRDGLATVAQERGRFRSFILAAYKNFASRERSKAHAQKRGEGQRPLELDAQTAEQRYAIEPADDLSPDRLYDQRWARLLLERAQNRLREEYAASGKIALFERLRPVLGVSRAELSYAALGAELGLSEGAVKVAAHRLRERYRTALRAEVAETVGSAEEIDAELRQLIDAL